MYAILLTKGGRKKTKKKAREIVLLNLNIPVIFCLFSFFFEMARRGLRRAGSRKCNFLDGDKGRAVRRLVTSKLLPLHRDASKSHPRPRETRENKMGRPGSRANCYLKSVPASRAMITSFSPMSAPTMARDIYSAFV